MRGKFLTTLLLLFSITACASTNIESLEEVGTSQLHEDENRLWQRSKEEQSRLDRSTYIYDDPILIAYVNHVATRLVPEDLKATGFAIQIKILRNPLLNAFAYPNGAIYIHTGLLAKMENEAQLATLIGHEMSHVIFRHTLKQYRSMKNVTAVLATVQVVTLPAGVYGDLASLLGTIGAMAAVTGYSKESEREADEKGLSLMIKAGYDPSEAPRLFEHLKKDVEEEETKEAFFFSTHPRLQERIENYNTFLKEKYVETEGFRGENDFMANVLPILLENAELDLSMGRFSSAEQGIGRFLTYHPRNAKAHFLLGELNRQHKEEANIAKAISEYEKAIISDPSYPDPYKALGMIYYKKGLGDESVTNFEKYLLLSPDAKDRMYIEQYIEKMKDI